MSHTTASCSQPLPYSEAQAAISSPAGTAARTRKQLQQFSKAELIEIILRQQAFIEQLQVQVTELEEQIRALTGPPKDASNSSIPPSQSPQPNRRGGLAGGHSLFK